MRTFRDHVDTPTEQRLECLLEGGQIEQRRIGAQHQAVRAGELLDDDAVLANPVYGRGAARRPPRRWDAAGRDPRIHPHNHVGGWP